MKDNSVWLSVISLAILHGGMAGAQEVVKPITVLQDTSPVMYERSAKIKTTVEAIDLESREITLKGPRGRTITLRVEESVKNLPQAQVSDKVVVRYNESVGLQLRKVEAGDSVAIDAAVAANTQPGQKPTAGGSKQITVQAYVEAVMAKEKTVTLRTPDGNLVDLYVRDLNVLASLAVGDNVVARYTEAVAVSIELPQEKEKPKAKKKKK
jgi:hypothetical protein